MLLELGRMEENSNDCNEQRVSYKAKKKKGLYIESFCNHCLHCCVCPTSPRSQGASHSCHPIQRKKIWPKIWLHVHFNIFKKPTNKNNLVLIACKHVDGDNDNDENSCSNKKKHKRIVSVCVRWVWVKKGRLCSDRPSSLESGSGFGAGPAAIVRGHIPQQG